MKISSLAVAVDSSGSVDDVALSSFCAELGAALAPYDTEAVILFHDCRVQAVHRIHGRELPSSLTPVGGGGTDFRPVTAPDGSDMVHRSGMRLLSAGPRLSRPLARPGAGRTDAPFRRGRAHDSAGILEHVQFETLCVSNHTACRLAKKRGFAAHSGRAAFRPFQGENALST